jgi:flagella basal body P-ring formation protein FlgA
LLHACKDAGARIKRHFDGSTLYNLRIGHIWVNHRLFIGILLIGLTPLSSGATIGATSGATTRVITGVTTGLEQVSQMVKESLGEQVINMATDMGLADYTYNVQLNNLDSRLVLSTCPQSLDIVTPDALKLGRSQVKVSCKAKQGWALNVPINISLTTQVVVLNQPVSKGTLLDEQHLDYRTSNLGRLRNGYYLNKDRVIGQQSKRALKGQTVLNGHVILPALLINKGDKVMIMATKGAMSVKMPGEALSNGRKGKQIRVKNIRSSRIIRAKVVDSGLVVVNF